VGGRMASITISIYP